MGRPINREPLGFEGKETAMADEKNQTPDEAIKQLENADVAELEEEALEHVAGGAAADNTNCFNSGCCKPKLIEV
jgi:hypothetical protein